MVDLPLTGAMPALVTPMRSASELDLAAAADLTEQAVARGAAGVVVAGSTGEGTLLAPADRRAITAAAVATGVPIIAGASGATLDDLHADVARLAGAGAQAVLVLAPGYQPLTPDELVALHLAVADRADVPTLVYHIPQFTGSPLTAEAVGALAAHPGVVGLKDSSPDAERRAAFVRAARDGLRLFVGHAPTLGAALRAGAAGSITALANLRLGRIVALHGAIEDGDDERSAALQTSITAAETALRAVPASMPAAVKAAMQLDGTLAERYCVPPLHAVAGPQLDLVRTALLR